MASVILKDVKKSFGNVEVLKGINLTIEDGSFCVFVGPSGCGKSTLLPSLLAWKIQPLAFLKSTAKMYLRPSLQSAE